MFKFLLGVAFGAAGYWAWQSFGRDLLGMGGDQDTAYGSFSSTPGSSSFNSGTSSYGGSSYGGGSAAPGSNSSSTPSSGTPSSTSGPGSSGTP